MARLTSSITIDDRRYEVRELTVKQILEILQDESLTGQGSTIAEIKQGLEDHLDKATDLTLDQMQDMAPSEIKQVYDKFKEVNATFFEVARSVGLEKLVSELIEQISEDFGKFVADSLNQVT